MRLFRTADMTQEQIEKQRVWLSHDENEDIQVTFVNLHGDRVICFHTDGDEPC